MFRSIWQNGRQSVAEGGDGRGGCGCDGDSSGGGGGGDEESGGGGGGGGDGESGGGGAVMETAVGRGRDGDSGGAVSGGEVSRNCRQPGLLIVFRRRRRSAGSYGDELWCRAVPPANQPNDAGTAECSALNCDIYCMESGN